MLLSSEYSIYLVISGILGGILAGMFGMGGGVVYTFIIPLFLNLIPGTNFTPDVVIANSFAAVFFASLSSAIQLFRKGELPWKQIIIASIFAVLASFLTSQYIVNQSWYQMKHFRIVVLLMILVIILRIVFKQKDEIKRVEKKLDMPIIGSFGGLVAAISGFGGGVVMVPLMLFSGIFNLKTAKNISLGVIVIVSATIVFRAMFQEDLRIPLASIGYIIPQMCLFLIVGTVIGGPFGVKLAARLSDKVLLNSYLSFLSVLMIYYLFLILK